MTGGRGMRLLLLLVALASCDVSPKVPRHEECVEFTHETVRAGHPVKCQMLWCYQPEDLTRRSASGIATLWCDQ